MDGSKKAKYGNNLFLKKDNFSLLLLCGVFCLLLVEGHWGGAGESVQVDVRLLLLRQTKRDWALLDAVTPLLGKHSSRRWSWGWRWSSLLRWRRDSWTRHSLLRRLRGHQEVRWHDWRVGGRVNGDLLFLRWDLFWGLWRWRRGGSSVVDLEIRKTSEVLFLLTDDHHGLADNDVLGSFWHQDAGKEHIVRRFIVHNLSSTKKLHQHCISDKHTMHLAGFHARTALSVSISQMISPAVIRSPSFMFHLAKLPLSMVGESAARHTTRTETHQRSNTLAKIHTNTCINLLPPSSMS